MSEHEVLERVLPYVPPHWVRQAFAEPSRTLAGREDRFYAAVLYVDISGFTPISEALSQRGHEGVEELSAILDRYFTTMAKPVLALGGEVVKFAGDSLIVLFPVQPDGGDAHLGAALHCSLRMQEAMSEFAQVRTSAGTFPLRMKIGMGEGAIYTTTVGDERNGMQSVFAGRPIARCIQAEDQAEPGEIVADAALVSRMPGSLDIGDARGTFRLIAGATDTPVLPPIDQPDVSSVDSERAALLVSRLAPYLPDQVVERIHQGQRGAHSEHRRVTIMFVKFGGLNYDLEPSVGRVLQTYFTEMRDCILRYGGRLNEVDIVADGGTLVVFFGAPTAHEDDELRAVACAWEMQQAVAEVSLAAGVAAERLRQCIGISSGRVFVGDVGAPMRRTYTAVGEEVNLASRLMNLAHWGEVVVTAWVQERAAGRSEFEAMGEVRLKGLARPVPVFALIARSAASGQSGLLPDLMERRVSIGRAAELATLGAVQERAWQGEPQLLLITGEAGVGKSHLVGELARDWVARGGRVLAGDGNRQGGRGPFGLWLDLLRAAFDLHDADPASRQRERIDIQLTLLSPSLTGQARFLGDLLDVETSPAAVQRAASPEQLAHLHRTLTDLFRSIAQRQSLLLVLENLHDADEASLTLLNSLLYALRDAPLLVCAACRLRQDLRLPDAPISTTRLVLDALSEADSVALAVALLEGAGLPPDLAPLVVDQARGNPFLGEAAGGSRDRFAGNPFYLREIVDALAGFDDPAAALSQRIAIPESISDTVQAQLDPLGEDSKLTMRIAAVIGPVFSFRVLQAAHPLPVTRRDLARRLSGLERMHLVRMEQFGDDIYYRFRHAVTQQVIYASLLSTDRERFHRYVGDALEKVFLDDLEQRYALLADHFYRGNQPAKATNYWLLAGERAVQAHAVREALAHYDRAEQMLSSCEAQPSRCIRGVQLRLLLGRGHVHLQLAQTEEAIRDYEQAAELARGMADLEGLGKALLSLGEIALNQARYSEAHLTLVQAMQRFSALGDRGSMARALLLLGRNHALQGQFDYATRYIQQAMNAREDVGDQAGSAECKSWLAALEFATGYRGQALETLQRSIELGRRSGEQNVVAGNSLRLAQALIRRGWWGRALDRVQDALGIYQASGTRLDVAEAQRILALVLTQIGSYEEAIDHLDQAMTAFADADWRVGLASGFWVAGEALLALGRYELSAERFHQAQTLGRDTHTLEPIVRAQLGLSKLAAVSRNWPEGQRLCTEARAWARQAGLGSLVIAARLGLTRAYLGRGEWRRAQREASQALDGSYRLRCPWDTFRASASLGEALRELGQPDRARDLFGEAYDVTQELADTLPSAYARIFLDRPYVRTVCDRARQA